MTQIFRPQSNTLSKLSLIGVGVILIGLFAIGGPLKWSSYFTEVHFMRTQPIQFSHKHHVKGDGIDCRYCHTSVETSATAGMPPSETCMTCHSQIWTNSPLLKQVRESYQKNIPIQWNRINFVPDYVFFNHSIHVNKGVGCASCHGQIDSFPLTMKVRTFYMKDCLSCHRNPEKNLRPKSEIFNLEWQPPSDSQAREELGRKLLKDYRIDSHRITNCYTCHR